MTRCPHPDRPVVALGKCQVCWGRWRAKRTEAQIMESLRRECRLCRREFAPLDPRREWCSEHCRDIERHTSPLEHLYVVWTEAEARRLVETYARHQFVQVPPLTPAGRPRNPYYAAWQRGDDGPYVVRASKLPEELSPIFGNPRLDGAPQKELS